MGKVITNHQSIERSPDLVLENLNPHMGLGIGTLLDRGPAAGKGAGNSHRATSVTIGPRTGATGGPAA